MKRHINSLIISFILLQLVGCATVDYSHQIKTPQCASGQIIVTGRAQSFVGDSPLRNTMVTWLELGRQYRTNRLGEFAFCARPNRRMTLELQSPIKTQIATLTLKQHNLMGHYREATFQVPRSIVFNGLKTLLLHERHAKMRPGFCHVVTTVTARGKTLADDPQGLDGAQIAVWQHGKKIRLAESPFYFAIIGSKTNPFIAHRNTTSRDGGALIFNLKPSAELYTLKAYKLGLSFRPIQFWCRPNSFINLSPPYSPGVID